MSIVQGEQKMMKSQIRKERPSAGAILWSALLVLGMTMPLAAQRSVPNIGKEIEGGTRPAGESAGEGERVKPRPPRPVQPNRRRRAARRAAAEYSRLSFIEVTFITGVPDVAIYWMDRGTTRFLGRTGDDGRVRLRLLPGTYDIIASRPGYASQRKQITVSNGANSFDFDYTNVAKGVSASSATAKEVIERFVDPQRTDSVTLDDWQAALAQIRGELINNPVDSQLRARADFVQGQINLLSGNHSGAIVAFNSAALRMRDSALAYWGLGSAYLATNRLREAERAYQRAVELDARSALAFKGLGDVAVRQGKTKEAIEYYKRAMDLGYRSPEMMLQMAQALLRQRRWGEALPLLEEVARVRPSAEVFIAVGDAYVGLGKPMSAAPAYKRAMELDPKSALAYYKYGELSFEMREYGDALQALERALVLDQQGRVINLARARQLASRAAEMARRER